MRHLIRVMRKLDLSNKTTKTMTKTKTMTMTKTKTKKITNTRYKIY